MKKFKIITIVFLIAFGLLDSVSLAKNASVLLREGLYAEEVEGNIDAAIKIYEQIIQDSSASRNYVAQALYRQGMCYLKKKDENQVKVVFGKLVAEYGDQTEIIGKAKPFLDDLMNSDPADLMPPETLIYVELGSPGKQIETILNMLKGTPFENPLAVIPGPSGPVGPGGKSPQDILGALLNPSMMAEFKKIRGMAIGITSIVKNNPPLVAVLYPGKSDALRGIILAGLGIVGQRSEPIEGMETLNIQNSAAVAYDDKVIIIAQPAERLEWCIKQYKGIISEPTLASSNKSFAKVSKKARQDNALTLWTNVDEVYTSALRQFPEGKSPKEMLWANTIADFGNIDDLIMYVSIEEDGFVYKADVLFRDGHHCLAYDMIRTPNLSRAGLEVVPSEAVALVSLALGQPDGTQAKAVSQKIQNVTGLDIGREIFANIEQITLFAMPSDKAFISQAGGLEGIKPASGGIPFLPNCIGLAITSHNPQQTRQILTTLLGTANLLTGDQEAGQTDPTSGKYQIGIVNNQRLYCYMDQLNKATVLSLNQNITDASIAAIKKRTSVCTAGPLKDAIGKLLPTTSKLVLVNVGGAIRLATPAMIESFENSDRERIQQALNQLAQSCSQTTIELRTDEQINNFGLFSGISGLPPINQVFEPAMQISQMLSDARAKARVERRKAEVPATIVKTTKAPEIDGTIDDIWSVIHEYKIGNVIYSPVSSDKDFSAYYKAMWDAENLYLLVDVTDDILKNDSVEFYYDDTVEVFIDADNSKESGYGENDYTYNFNWDRTSPSMEERGQPYQNDDIKFALATSANGYQLEIKFPWSTLGTKPTAGTKIGLDVHVNDDDDGGDRETKLAWRDREDNAWQNPQAFGTAELAGLIGWWKFDESEGSAAADSSGNGNDGSLHGNPVWRPNDGKIRGALEFDGADDYVEIEQKSSFSITGQITLSVWVKTDDAGNGEHNPYVAKGDHSYAIKHYEDSSIEFFIYDDGWHAVRSPVDSSFNGQWHHLAGTYDGVQIKLYIDGALQGTTDHVGSIATDDFAVNIGRNSEHTDRFYAGLIDDVRISNYALKQDDIMALYNEGVKR